MSQPRLLAPLFGGGVWRTGARRVEGVKEEGELMRDDERRSRRGWVAILWALAVVSAAAGPATLSGQTFDLGVNAGFFVDYPHQFSGDYCEQGSAGLALSAAWKARPVLAVEVATVVTTGTPDQLCVLPLSVAPLPTDTPFERGRYADHILDGGLFATNLAVVLEPWPEAPVSPRARLGAGLLWDKELGNWLWGIGVKYRFGRHALTTDVEGWNLEIERFIETVIIPSSTHEPQVLSSYTVDETSRPLLIRIGWELSVG